MRVLVTGAGGYLGSACVDLLARRHDVIGFGHGTHFPFLRKKLDSSVQWIEGSTENISDFIPRLGDVDVVIHMAVRFNSLRSVVHFCQTTNVSRIIFPSTYAVYSNSDKSLSEMDALCPETEYAKEKEASEQFLRESDMSYTILRLSHVYGPGVGIGDEGGVLVRWLDQAIRGMDIEVIDGETIERDYTHLRDVISCVEASLENSSAMRRIYNVGSGVVVTLLELAQEIINAVGEESGQCVGIQNISSQPPVLWKKRVDIRRAGEELKFYPRIKLIEGIREMVRSRRTTLLEGSSR